MISLETNNKKNKNGFMSYCKSERCFVKNLFYRGFTWSSQVRWSIKYVRGLPTVLSYPATTSTMVQESMKTLKMSNNRIALLNMLIDTIQYWLCIRYDYDIRTMNVSERGNSFCDYNNTINSTLNYHIVQKRKLVFALG